MNALDVETLGELRDRLTELGEDDGVRVIVLTGAGDKAFAAGADIKYMSGLSVEAAKEWGGLGHQVGQLLETAPKVSIAAINGLRAWRRLRARARVRHPLRGVDREARAAGGQPRDLPRLGRDPTARAGLRRSASRRT